MLRRLLQRVLYTLPVIWLVVSLVFLLIHLVPGDPIAQMLGEGAPAADIAATRHAYGLDAPLGDQYIRYWKGVLHGDLGRSIRYNETMTRLMPTPAAAIAGTTACSQSSACSACHSPTSRWAPS